MFQCLSDPVTEQHLRHSTQSTAAVLQQTAAADTFLLLRSIIFEYRLILQQTIYVNEPWDFI